MISDSQRLFEVELRSFGQGEGRVLSCPRCVIVRQPNILSF